MSQPSPSPKQVKVNDEVTKTFDAQQKTLLQCLESENIEVHYHCRDGFCGVCRCKLTKGQVSYPNGEPLAYLSEGEILPCCCVPHTDIAIELE